MKNRPSGFTLVETMIAVFVVSICLLGVVKLMSGNQTQITTSIGDLQTLASAEELFHRISRMKWDANSPASGGVMLLTGAPAPRIDCAGACPDIANRTAVEHWSGHIDYLDTTRSNFKIKQTVQVNFVRLDMTGKIYVSSTPTDRKAVVVTAYRDTVNGRKSTATVSGIFYNLP